MRLQATAALAGALALFAWRGGPVAGSVVVVAGVLALLSWAAPRLAEPIHRALDRAVELLLAALTWCLLALVFAIIFVPGRLVLGRARRPLAGAPAAGSTYWRPCRARNDARSFERQY